MNGNITKEGITADLEAISRVGLGGVQLFDVKLFFLQLEDVLSESEKVHYMSPEWLGMLKHAANECLRLNLELTLNACAGWSTTGGPWVKPDQSMQKLVWSETRIKGPEKITVILERPPDVFGPFQDITTPYWEGFIPTVYQGKFFKDVAVIAYRLPTSVKPSMRESFPVVTSSLSNTDISTIFGNSLNTGITFPAVQKGKDHFIQLEFEEPFSCSSLTIKTTASEWQLESGNDGIVFIPVVKNGILPRYGNAPNTYVFEEVSSRFYRLNMNDQETFDIMKFTLNSEPKIHRWEVKAGFDILTDNRALTGIEPSSEFAIDPAQVMDITNMMDSNGLLSWQVPEGEWVVLRLGRSSTGRPNWPAAPAGLGLECDKLSQEAVQSFYNGLMDPVKEVLGPLVGKGLKNLLIDSWESDHLNWTKEFCTEFQKRRGYDPTPYLPAMTGVLVKNKEVSDRFLRDIRRTIADLIADHHYGTIRKLAHHDNMGLYAEALGLRLPWICDQLQAKGNTDIPMGEFWIENNPGYKSINSLKNQYYCDIKEAASAAHIYGKKIAAAESFTSRPEINHWGVAPFWLKAMGDYYFTLGINRLIMHTYAHQPVNEKKPGMSLGPWGQHFSRHITWWENGANEWIRYLSRCQLLLQKGSFAADVCYYYGDDVPLTVSHREELVPVLPPGYDYDVCNTEVLLERMNVNNGRVCLPDGLNYAILVLPDDSVMIPSVARKIKSLVKAGAIVVGPKPIKSSSLSDYPSCDDEVAGIGAEVWGNCNGQNIKRNKYGIGQVIWGLSLTEILEEIKLKPDFSFKSLESDADIGYIHRKEHRTDIYFLQNRLNKSQTVLCSFRTSGKQPELWYPDNGDIREVAVFYEEDGLVQLPIRFDEFGSVFVLFREPVRHIPVSEVRLNGNTIISALEPVSDTTLERNDPDIILAFSDDGDVAAKIFTSGSYELRFSDGTVRSFRTDSIADKRKVTGSWNLRFPMNYNAPESILFDTLISWHTHPNEGIKYFSGSAVYEKKIDISAESLSQGKHQWIDLGNVKDIVTIKCNGIVAGTIWKPPYCIDITPWLKPGANKLELEVTNLWPNRLIGDQNIPENQRYTWTSLPVSYRKDHPLFDAGLLGPVYLKESVSIEIQNE